MQSSQAPRSSQALTRFAGCAWLLLAAFLAACSPVPMAPLPTALPDDYLPTAIALTIQADMPRLGITTTLAPRSTEVATPVSSPAASPTVTPYKPLLPTPTPTFTATPERLPTRTPSPTPTPAIPNGAIQILAPGPASRLISPLRMNTFLQPGLDGRVQVELLGEDGRLLLRKIYKYLPEVNRTYLTEELPFEIRQVGETARLQISTFDRFNRLLAFNSVDLVLLSFGENDITPTGSLLERVLITEPLPNKLIQGGMLVVAGHVHASDAQPILVELTTAQGKVIGYRQASIIANERDASYLDYVPFRAEVSYTVTEPTWVRLSVRLDSDGRIAGTVYLTSEEILLSP